MTSQRDQCPQPKDILGWRRAVLYFSLNELTGGPIDVTRTPRPRAVAQTLHPFRLVALNPAPHSSFVVFKDLRDLGHVVAPTGQ